jgi:methylmalonyl-CoA/ethylmalonyl-CoA epimerase
VVVTRTVLDHVAVATRVLRDGWDLFGGVLGGSWAHGGNDPGFWWGQLSFRTGPKIELLTPTGGPDAAFLERFLASRGPGPHHLNFSVSDIGAALRRVRALGIEPVGVSLDSPTWKEAFLHPRDAHGIVIQVAQQSGPPPRPAAPADLPAPGAASDFELAELHVHDIKGAVRLYAAALDGEVVSNHATDGEQAVDLTWRNGTRIRLVSRSDRPAAESGMLASGGLARLSFARQGPAFSDGELSLAATLSHRLGVTLGLRG